MEFRGKNPGAVQFGNFINYYQFNSPEERLRRLEGLGEYWLPSSSSSSSSPSSLSNEENSMEKVEPYLLLDVGCNVGCLTQELYRYCQEIMPDRQVQILAVDCDPNLVETARKNNSRPEMITYKCVNIMNVANCRIIQDYLSKYKRERFNAVCCFGITMWIHLNHHDEGLKDFLRLMSDWAELLVLEPQPWKCYQTAQRRMSKAGNPFPLFLELKWRSNIEQEIHKYLMEHLQRRRTKETTATKWQRTISFYR